MNTKTNVESDLSEILNKHYVHLLITSGISLTQKSSQVLQGKSKQIIDVYYTWMLLPGLGVSLLSGKRKNKSKCRNVRRLIWNLYIMRYWTSCSFFSSEHDLKEDNVIIQKGDEILDNLTLSLIAVVIRKENLWMYILWVMHLLRKTVHNALGFMCTHWSYHSFRAYIKNNSLHLC